MLSRRVRPASAHGRGCWLCPVARLGPGPSGVKLRRRRNAVAKASAARSSANWGHRPARDEAVHDGKVDLETLLEVCEPNDGPALRSASLALARPPHT